MVIDDETSRLVKKINEEYGVCLISDETVNEWRAQMIDIYMF